MTPWMRNTLLLGIAVLGLGAVDVGLEVFDTGASDTLPVLAPVRMASARLIRMTTGNKTIELKRVGETGLWEITAPIQGPADSAAARDLVSLLRREVAMQVQIDTGNLEQYGLQSGTATRLQIVQDESPEPVIDLYVGRDTVGGASFVRFPDSDVVYRAQVGGSHRITREIRDWKDRQITRFEAETVTGLTLSLGDGQTLQFRKDGERWALPDDPSFPVDQQTVADILERVSTKRAGQVLPGDFPLPDAPIMRVRIERKDTPELVLSIYQADGVAYVKRTGRDEVFQVSPGWVRGLALPRVAWLDRQFMEVERTHILRMVYHDPDQGDLILEQDVADGRWRMIQPPNVDANLRETVQASLKLGGLRAEGIADVPPETAGFPSPAWIELQLINGEKRRIELGFRVPKSDVPRLFVRTADQPDRIGVMPIAKLLEIKKAWGQ
ncbi:MAG: DUF4340 domain-containing protein [Myxococcota bacterium]